MIYLWFPIVCMLFHDYMSVTSVGESFVMGYGQYGTSIFCLPAEEREYFFRGTGVGERKSDSSTMVSGLPIIEATAIIIRWRWPPDIFVHPFVI